jgi:hypothetical protein
MSYRNLLHKYKKQEFVSRYYSSANPGFAAYEIKPVAVYMNADEEKLNIFADNRNKAGIYR